MDIGQILENVVCLELNRRGYEVYVGKVDNYEVDFIATNVDVVEYYQVSASVRDQQTLKRELLSHQKITDNFRNF